MPSDEYVDPSSDSEYEYDNPLAQRNKLGELHKKFQAENANKSFSSSSDSEIGNNNSVINRGCGMLSVGTVEAEAGSLLGRKEGFNHQSTSNVINNKNKKIKVERKKKKKIIKTEVKKKDIKNVSKKKKNKRETRSRSNSTPENNFEEEEEENSPPTKLRHYLPRVAKDFTNAIKLSNATPQFQNQQSIGRRIRSDSGQSSRTYSRSRSPINSAADGISSAATKKCCDIIGHEPSECPILLEKHSQLNEEGVPVLPISVSNGVTFWEIEKVVDSKINEEGDVTELLVKWAYFTTPTWHSIDLIADSPQTLTDYFFEEGVKKTLETICNVSRNEKVIKIVEKLTITNPNLNLQTKFPSLFNPNSQINTDPTQLTRKQKQNNLKKIQKLNKLAKQP